MHEINLDQLTPEESKILNSLYPHVLKDLEPLFIELKKHYSSNEELLFTSLFSRDFDSNSLVRRCTLLAFVEEITKETCISKITLSDPLLARVLVHWAQVNKKSVDIIDCSKAYYVKSILSAGSNILKNVLKTFLKIAAKRKPKINNDKSYVLVDNFVTKTNLKNQKDSYYGDIEEVIKKKSIDCHVLRMPTFVGIKNYYSAIKKYRSYTKNTLVPEDFLKPTDYISNLYKMFKWLLLTTPTLNYKCIDLKPLIKSEILNIITSTSVFDALCFSKVPKKISYHGIKIHRYIDWYENQPIDRAFIYNFRKNFKKTPIVGHQGFYKSPSQYLSVFPDHNDIHWNMAPDIIASPSPAAIKTVVPQVQAFTSRYNYLYNKRNDKKTLEHDLLVLLPYNKKYAQNILNSIAPFNPSSKIIFKKHPAASYKLSTPSSSGISWTHKSTSTLIPDAKIVLTVASSTCLEALACGKKLIVYSPMSTICQDPSLFLNKTPKRLTVSNKDDLEKAINFFMSEQKIQDIDLSPEEVRNHFFPQCTSKTISTWLGIDEQK